MSEKSEKTRGAILRSRVGLNGGAEVGMCGNEVRNEKLK